MRPLSKLFVLLTLVIIQNANASREFINGTNYKCADEGNLIELPNHLRKPCMLCTCKKSLVVCEKLKPCAANYREDRKRRSIRCIEEECCNLVQDVFLNNVDSSSRLVTYRTLESDSSASEVINNQIRTSTIRYVHCTNELTRNNNYQNAPQNDRPAVDPPPTDAAHSALFEFNLKPFSSRSTINTRSVTAHPLDRQPDGLCTLSNSLNADTNKHRQYITTFDGMRMRLRNREHCHFVFARDCAGEQFTIHLLYSASNNHLATNRSSSIRLHPLDPNKSAGDRSAADRSDDRFLDSINLSAINPLDGKSTSNYTQRYLSTLKQSRIYSKEKLNLFVRIGKRKLRMDHSLNVKLDNRLILLPYVHRGLKIVKHQSYVILKSEIGLKIIWSGQEVVASLPRYYQRRTCGLCSNYNGDLTDDLKNRKNQPVSQLRFFQSWTTGKNRQCLVSSKRPRKIDARPSNDQPKSVKVEENSVKNSTTCKWTFKRKMKATRFCNSLKINLPAQCQEAKNYFEDCLERMCPCNRKSCNCDILGSYVAKCSQDLENSPSPQPPLNVTMFRGECPNFDFNLASQPNNTHLNQSRAARNLDPLDRLELPKCPEGSAYSPCAPIDKYKVTCSDLLPRSESSNRLPEQMYEMDVCQPGCKCKASTVWSDSSFAKCIHIDLCSSLSSNIRKRTINSLNNVLRPRLTFLN